MCNKILTLPLWIWYGLVLNNFYTAAKYFFLLWYRNFMANFSFSGREVSKVGFVITHFKITICMFLVLVLFSPGDFRWYLFTTISVDQVWGQMHSLDAAHTDGDSYSLLFCAFYNESKRQITLAILSSFFLLVWDSAKEQRGIFWVIFSQCTNLFCVKSSGNQIKPDILRIQGIEIYVLF